MFKGKGLKPVAFKLRVNKVQLAPRPTACTTGMWSKPIMSTSSGPAKHSERRNSRLYRAASRECPALDPPVRVAQKHQSVSLLYGVSQFNVSLVKLMVT
jgi:hypothetical protein